MEDMAFEDFLGWNVGHLQFYFRMRRRKSTTGNKKDLVARALVAIESKDPIVDCSKDISDRLNRLLSTAGTKRRSQVIVLLIQNHKS